MSDSTSITKELRYQWNGAAIDLGISPTTALFKGVMTECNRIDELYKALEDKCADTRLFADRIYKALGDECTELQTFCKHLHNAAEKRKDVDLWGVTYTATPEDNTALPPDADGVIVHIGDDMEIVGEPGIHGKIHGKVYCMKFTGDDWWICFEETTQRAAVCRHHKSTIAEVLREFANEWANTDADDQKEDKIIERYIKRLQLANDTKNRE